MQPYSETVWERVTKVQEVITKFGKDFVKVAEAMIGIEAAGP
jgi:hypothetical protein